MMNIHEELKSAEASGLMSAKTARHFQELYDSYVKSLEGTHHKAEDYVPLFAMLLELVKKQIADPYPFEPYHPKIVEPFDYFHYGLNFARPLVDERKSRILRTHNLDKIDAEIKAGENVVFFANHQTELDPQLMSIVLEKDYPLISDEIIFVAGDRVLTDPLAVPFSLGRNLLCIYSKRHIDNPPEKKAEKQQHNKRTMNRMKSLLAEGGKCIYVALSGGRDRPSPEGEIEIAKFDPSSLEMFRLMAKEAGKATHFYPLALMTYDILPPPDTISKELGETRTLSREGACFAFGDEIDFNHFPGSDIADKHERRQALADHVWNMVHEDYKFFKGEA